MALGSMRYCDVSTMALTPPSTGTLSCSTESELSRQAPRGRSVRQRLQQSRNRAGITACPLGIKPWGPTEPSRRWGWSRGECSKASPKPSPHRSTMQSLRGCGAMLSIT